MVSNILWLIQYLEPEGTGCWRAFVFPYTQFLKQQVSVFSDILTRAPKSLISANCQRWDGMLTAQHVSCTQRSQLLAAVYTLPITLDFNKSLHFSKQRYVISYFCIVFITPVFSFLLFSSLSFFSSCFYILRVCSASQTANFILLLWFWNLYLE
jgi:hypothetical protein